jgi:hypothetical protein
VKGSKVPFFALGLRRAGRVRVVWGFALRAATPQAGVRIGFQVSGVRCQPFAFQVTEGRPASGRERKVCAEKKLINIERPITPRRETSNECLLSILKKIKRSDSIGDMLTPDTRNLKPLPAIQSLTRAFRVPGSDNGQPTTTNKQLTTSNQRKAGRNSCSSPWRALRAAVRRPRSQV